MDTTIITDGRRRPEAAGDGVGWGESTLRRQLPLPARPVHFRQTAPSASGDRLPSADLRRRSPQHHATGPFGRAQSRALSLAIHNVGWRLEKENWLALAFLDLF